MNEWLCLLGGKTVNVSKLLFMYFFNDVRAPVPEQGEMRGSGIESESKIKRTEKKCIVQELLFVKHMAN